MIKQKKKRSYLAHRMLSLVLLTTLSIGIASAQVRISDRDDYAKQAQNQFENANWEGGKETLDAGLQKYPKNSDLKMLLGKYYHHHKQYDKARYELKKSLEQNPNNVEAKQVLINVETESGRYSSAICYINELLEINPYWKGLWLKKIELYTYQGNIVEANRLSKRINQIYPYTHEDNELREGLFYNMEIDARQKRNEGKFDEAISIRKDLVQQQPGNANYYLNLINDYLKAGDQNNAMIYIDRGINHFPGDMAFINKKAGLLAEQKRYNELLAFLQQQMRQNNSPALRQQYNYYLSEAARTAKESDPTVLYGKIFENSPGNEEAFSYVFNHLLTNQQYEEALEVLRKHEKARGKSKELSMKELMVYNRMGATGHASTLTKSLFAQYPDDYDLREAYVRVMMNEAKAKMVEENYSGAINDFNQVRLYDYEGEMGQIAQSSIYNAYMAIGDYNNALNTLNYIIEMHPENPELYIKRADIYMKQKRYPPALTAYEIAIEMVDEEKKIQHLEEYSEMYIFIIKELNEQFRYDESMQYVERWLEHDPNNLQALYYAVNLSYARKNHEEMHRYAQRGCEIYSEDIFFKRKLAEAESSQVQNYASAYTSLHRELLASPYHEELINTFAQVSENYGMQLIKEKESTRAVVVIDTALRYSPNNRSLKYVKGLAFEKLQQYDSAYYYQSFYEPSLLEFTDTKQQLRYLNYKSYRNEVTLSYLRSRHGDNPAISTISTLGYNRYSGINTYTGLINYAGRESGKGFQLQAEWAREWTPLTRTRIDAAWANRFFPKIAANASVYHDFNFWNGIEGELGIGYKRLSGKENLLNLVVGATKELDPWRFNVRFNNFLLDWKWLYSASANIRYNISSPKNYILAVAGIGSAPDVDIINYQLYNGFSVLNTMVGAGIGHILFKNVSLNALGTWHNYRVDNVTEHKYRNLYTIYLNLNVAF